MQHTNILFICTENMVAVVNQLFLPTEVLDRKQKEKRLSCTGYKECSELISVRKDRSSYGRFSRASPMFFYGSNPRRKRSQESSRGLWTLRNQTPKDLRSTFLRLLDVGLSKLCPKTNSQLRFARSLQVKTDILLTKVIRGKVVEEIELIYVHCFTTQEFKIKTIKNKDSLSQSLQNKFLSRPLHFWNKSKVFGCH